jgi:hypothetical protein
MAHNIRMLAGSIERERSVDPALSTAFSRDGAGALRMTYWRFSFALLASVGIGVRHNNLINLAE